MKNSSIDKIINQAKGQHSFPNFIVLVFISLLLVIDFLPYFKSLEIINLQYLYLSLLNLIIGFYFYFNSNLVSTTIFRQLKGSYITRLYFVFILVCAISVFVAKNVSLVFTKFTEIIIVLCLFINLSILLKDKLDLLYKIVFIVSIAAFIQSWQQLCNFVVIPKHASIIELLSAMKGNTGNINILAASLSIKVPFILLGISHFKDYKKFLLLVTLFSVTTVIFLTAARASLLNLFLLFTVYSIFLLREYSFNRSTFAKVIYIIIPVAISFVFSNSIFEKSKDKGRYESVENRILKINSSDQSSQARFVYWNNVLEMAQKNPIMGIGLGNYQIESIPYEKTTSNDSIVSLHAHNDFLEIFAETGILNFLIYFSIFVVILFVNLKNVFKSTDKNKRTIAMLALMVLIVYGIDSTFNFPMYRPTMQIFFSLLLALTVINNSKKEEIQEVGSKTVLSIVFPAIIIVSIITSCSAYIIYKASNLEYLIVTDDINMNEKGFLTGDEVMKRMPSYPNVFQSSESFYEYAGIYYFREKNYDKAFKCFSKANKINPYSGRIDFYKQLIALKTGKTDSAYFYSKRAFYTRPRNFALYQSSIRAAGINKDTLEILKEHQLYTKYRNEVNAWQLATNALQNAGYNYKSVLNFINKGLKTIPNDTTLLTKKTSLQVTDYIIEGQKFESELKLDKALQSYQKALKIDPKNIYAFQNIGFYYYKFGQNKKAIQYLLEAIKYPGLNDGKTEFFLGSCYLQENDKQNACKYFNLAKAKNYTNPRMSMFAICN